MKTQDQIFEGLMKEVVKGILRHTSAKSVRLVGHVFSTGSRNTKRDFFASTVAEQQHNLDTDVLTDVLNKFCDTVILWTLERCKEDSFKHNRMQTELLLSGKSVRLQVKRTGRLLGSLSYKSIYKRMKKEAKQNVQ